MSKTYHPAIRNGKPVLVEEAEIEMPLTQGRYVNSTHGKKVDEYEKHLASREVLEVSKELVDAFPELWYKELGFKYDESAAILNPEGYTGVETLVEGISFKIVPTAIFIEGHYSNTCISCQKLFSDTDKKWLLCKNCCEKPIAVPLSSGIEAVPVKDKPLTNAQVREQLYKLLPLFLIQNCQYNDGERLLVKRLVQSFEPVNPEYEKYNEENPGHGLPNQ